MEEMRKQSEKFKSILTNPDECQFVAVCIPEYLSVYETERLCQELAKSDIDIRNIVVNQIVIPESDCFKCKSRYKMQSKYLKQIHDLYCDFHIVLSALQNEEVKGVKGLVDYGNRLLSKLELPEVPK